MIDGHFIYNFNDKEIDGKKLIKELDKLASKAGIQSFNP